MNTDEKDDSDLPDVEKSRNYQSLESYFKIGGIASLLFGVMHAANIIANGFKSILLSDAIINSLFGVLLLISLLFLSKRKKLVIWIFGSTIAISIIYGLAVGRGFNFIYAIFGGVALNMLLGLKKTGEIT